MIQANRLNTHGDDNTFDELSDFILDANGALVAPLSDQANVEMQAADWGDCGKPRRLTRRRNSR